MMAAYDYDHKIAYIPVIIEIDKFYIEYAGSKNRKFSRRITISSQERGAACLRAQ